jgi:uncharacterized cofD-like protein
MPLVKAIGNAIGKARATKIFIANLMTQPGETDGYDVRGHLEACAKYAPQIQFDYVVVNNRAISSDQAEIYRADGAYQIGLDDDIQQDQLGPETQLVRTDLLDAGEMVRHNAERLARVVIACAERARSQTLVGAES